MYIVQNTNYLYKSIDLTVRYCVDGRSKCKYCWDHQVAPQCSVAAVS